MSWLDHEDRLAIGDYAGRELDEVAQENPDYLVWIIENTDIDSEEIAYIEEALDYAGHLD